nr:hypothetical protein BaRGS_023561 [Batillaria attramentaria]
MTSSEEYEMKLFHLKVRVEHGIPPGLQRPDDKCGNVTLGPFVAFMHPLLWYRGLCDPDGQTPCCYDNVCVSRPKEQCACPHCYDLRRTIHAEHATWHAERPECQPLDLSVQQMCKVLDNATLYFIGDSFVRHVYTAFLLAGRADDFTGAFLPNAPPGIRAACPGIYMFTEKVCRHWLDRDALICRGRTRIKFFELVYIKQAQQIHKTILELRNTSRSLVLVGTGIHDNFKANETQQKVLLPLMQRMKSENVTRPKVVWAATHAPGLMKTPRVPEQSYESVLKYNMRMKEFLTEWQVPVFDTFNMTDGLMSFDGAHYGLGANKVKARIFLNYLLELYLNHEW